MSTLMAVFNIITCILSLILTFKFGYTENLKLAIITFIVSIIGITLCILVWTTQSISSLPPFMLLFFSAITFIFYLVTIPINIKDIVAATNSIITEKEGKIRQKTDSLVSYRDKLQGDCRILVDLQRTIIDEYDKAYFNNFDLGILDNTKNELSRKIDTTIHELSIDESKS